MFHLSRKRSDADQVIECFNMKYRFNEDYLLNGFYYNRMCDIIKGNITTQNYRYYYLDDFAILSSMIISTISYYHYYQRC